MLEDVDSYKKHISMASISIGEKESNEEREEYRGLDNSSILENEGSYTRNMEKDNTEEERKKSEWLSKMIGICDEKKKKEKWIADMITVKELDEEEELDGFAVYGHKDGVTLKFWEDMVVNLDRFGLVAIMQTAL